MLKLPQKLGWIRQENIRPYVFVRKENRIAAPGRRHVLDWFKGIDPIYKDPLRVDEVEFANNILVLEGQAFDESVAMERWVFYDCAILPGFVTGFAARTSSLSDSVKKVLKTNDSLEWTPLSLFIIIPTMTENEWVAHNLCSVNSLLPKEERLWGLGFVSKAFGLWYANIETCIGITQWTNPAVKLHSHYGHFKILTAYTPVHTYDRTLTYRLDVDTSLWPGFLGEKVNNTFKKNFESAGFMVERENVDSLKRFQAKIEAGEGEFYLDAEEILAKGVKEPLSVFKKRKSGS